MWEATSPMTADADPFSSIPSEMAADLPPDAPARHPVLLLQEIDLSIDRLSHRREALATEEGIRTARASASEAEARLGELQLEIDQLSREQGRLEGNIDSLDQKTRAEEKRLFDGSVANSKELQSIESEVAGLKARKGRMEDELLELMEGREELDGRTAQLEATLEEARQRLAEIETTSARELVEVEEALVERSAEREELAPRIDAELLELYESLRPQKKGVAAVALVDGVCQGCHQKLSPVYLDRMKRAEGVRRCEYCRRILISA